MKHLVVLLLFASYTLCGQQFKWSQKEQYPNATSGTHICADNNHNVYVTGCYRSEGSNHPYGPAGCFVHMYDKTGKLLWKEDLPDVSLSRIALTQHALLLSGTDSIGGFVSHYSFSGSFQYKTYVFKNNSTPYTFITGIGTDSLDNYYLIGRFGRTQNIGSITIQATDAADFFLLKFDPNDSCLWSKTGSGGFLNYANLRVDKAGNSFIGGYTYSLNVGSVNFTSPTPQALIVKFSPQGNLLFLRQGAVACSNPWWENWQTLTALGMDASGNVYYTGIFWGKIALGNDTLYSPNSDLFIGKLKSDGSPGWLRQVHDSMNAGEPGGLDVSALGNVYVSGAFSSGCMFDLQTKLKGFREPLIAKYNSAGQIQWAVKTDCSNAQSYGTGLGVAVDADEHIFVAGQFDGQMKFGGWAQSTSGLSMFVTMLAGLNGVGLSEHPSGAGWNIFPNPSSGNVHIETPMNTGRIILSDLTGRTVLDYAFSGNNQELNRSSLESGIYILTVSDDLTRYSTKLVLR